MSQISALVGDRATAPILPDWRPLRPARHLVALSVLADETLCSMALIGTKA